MRVTRVEEGLRFEKDGRFVIVPNKSLIKGLAKQAVQLAVAYLEHE